VHSTVANRVEAAPYRTGPHMSGVIYALCAGLDVEGYHWHYVPGASVGVIPTNGEVLVFAAVPSGRFMRELRFDLHASFWAVLDAAAPQLAAQVRETSVPGRFRGFAGHAGFIRPAWGPGWALVGDAGYFKDPLTAHGITDALRDASLLARAVEAGTDAALASYQAVRDELSVRLFDITDAIASFDWDMAGLQTLHKALSDEMAGEVLYLGELDAQPAAASTVAANEKGGQSPFFPIVGKRGTVPLLQATGSSR
jgi:menaquinone-9 beta-reductase